MQSMDRKDIVIWTTTLKRKILDNPDTVLCVMPILGENMQRVRCLEHQDDILHLNSSFQNISFDCISIEGEKAWEAMGTRKVIDSPPWSKVRNDMTGRYQHARIINDSGQLGVMKTVMIRLLVNRPDAENEELKQFLTTEQEGRGSEPSTEDDSEC